MSIADSSQAIKQKKLCTKMFQKRDSTAINHNIHIIPPKKKAKTPVST